MDKDIKDLRRHTDHELNNLRTGVELLLRRVRILEATTKKLKETLKCVQSSLQPNNTVSITAKHLRVSSEKEKEKG